MSTIYLAGGCYWGVEKYMSNVAGVTETEEATCLLGLAIDSGGPLLGEGELKGSHE